VVLGILKQQKVQPFEQERPEASERRGKEGAEGEALPQ